LIRVVGANPAMDRVSTWPSVRMGEVNRATEVSVVPGGKGFNVARATARLGCETATYGFLGGHVGEALRELILADGLIDRHTTIAGGTRVCFIVVEPRAGRSTVLNEPGPAVTAQETARFLDDLRADCRPGDVVVLSGSLPDSVDPDVAGEVVAIANAAGARTIIDIHSEALRHAAARAPWMLKCNRVELMGLLRGASADASESWSGLVRAMQHLRERGIEVVVVTLGGDGAMLADAEGVVHVDVPRVEVVNATGSGDLLLAGLAAGLERGQAVREAILLGAACGTAGATHLPPELPADFDPDAWVARLSVATVEPAL
jgi:1-phosphofructokinase family hexose kinase